VYSPNITGLRLRNGSFPAVTAYVISEVEPLDEELFAQYRTLAQETIEQYGGRYLVRGVLPDTLEGTWPAQQRIVILEFPSMEKAREWYASPEYARALEVRRHALDRRLLFVEGVEGSD
jgi:uncharacterized protein (DUF1330 family)